MKHIFLINSFTVKDKINEVIKKVMRYAEDNHLDYEIEVNSPTYDTEDIVRKYKHKKYLIIVIGGDGAVNRVLNEIIKTNNKMSIIPYGSGNDFYRSIKKDLEFGFNKVDIVKINKRYFINTACFGIDADVANNKDIVKSKYISKKQKYNISLIYNFFKYECRDFEVLINKETYKDSYTTIAVCNGSYYGGGYNIGPKSKINDGKLEVYMVSKVSKPTMVPLILKMKKGKHETSKKIKKFITDKVVIKSNKDVVANIDGEELKDKVFKIEILPNEIEIYYDEDLIKAIV